MDYQEKLNMRVSEEQRLDRRAAWVRFAEAAMRLSHNGNWQVNKEFSESLTVYCSSLADEMLKRYDDRVTEGKI